jgi:hypothetical protein
VIAVLPTMHPASLLELRRQATVALDAIAQVLELVDGELSRL